MAGEAFLATDGSQYGCGSWRLAASRSRTSPRSSAATRRPCGSYRQAEIFARDGVSLETSTRCGWVGATTALRPLVGALAAEVLAGDTLHVDDTPVLAPGTGKTKTGRLWS
jgi:hypothetical protein